MTTIDADQAIEQVDGSDAAAQGETADRRRPVFGAALPRAEQPERRRRTIAWRKLAGRVVGCVVVLFLLHLLYSAVVTTLVHDQRQQHLAADLQEPILEVPSGAAVAVLQIPSISVNEIVLEGVEVDHLRGGPARVTGSALPGDAGVMAIYGHRTAYGGPFERVVDLVSGDSVVVQARNSGPIVRYIVDRVERDTDVADIALEQTDLVSYLLLVTSEEGTFARGQAVVVARALPVTDTAPTVPLLADVGGSVPFGIDGLLALGSLVIAVLTVRHLRGRVATGVLVAVAAPVLVYAVLRIVMLGDTVLALTR